MDGLTVKEKETFVIGELMKLVYGGEERVNEGICILPVCLTTHVLKHFHGEDVISELMGL